MAIFRAALCVLLLAAAAAAADRRTAGQPDPSQCPAIDEEGRDVLFPNPEDCGTYWLCTYGRLVLMTCPPGLHFSPALLRCEYAHLAGCEGEARKAEPSCPPPGSGNDILLFPKPGNCSEYYQCDNGNLLIEACPPGLHFNPELHVCDHPWAAGCEKRAIPLLKAARKPPVAKAEPSCPPPGSGNDILLFPKPGNCSEYYQCDNGNLLIEACPPGLHFSPELHVCDHPWAAGCQQLRSDPACPPPGEGGLQIFPSPDSCEQFLTCDNGQIVVNDCPPGLHFNPTVSACDHPWAAGCAPSRSFRFH